MTLFFSEIVGYVDGLEAPRCVGATQQYKFFKFYLNNGSGKRVQVVVWNEDIERIESHIKSNYVIFKFLNIYMYIYLKYNVILLTY